MSNVDPVAIGAAVTQGIADAQQAAHQERLRNIQRAAAAAAGIVSVETLKDFALAYIGFANASPEEFTQGHLRVAMQATFPEAQPSDIEAAIRAAEGSL